MSLVVVGLAWIVGSKGVPMADGRGVWKLCRGNDGVQNRVSGSCRELDREFYGECDGGPTAL